MSASSAMVVLLPTLLTFLVTSGVWVGVYFVAGLNNREGGTVNNFYYDNKSDPNAVAYLSPSSSPLITLNSPTPPDTGTTCPRDNGAYSNCTSECEFILCESLPSDLYTGNVYRPTNTTSCWLRLIQDAKEEIIIGSSYWSLLLKETAEVTNDHGFAIEGEKIFNGLIAAAKRGISIKIALTDPLPEGHSLAEPFAIRDINPELVRVRSLVFPKWFGHGMLHTKSWVVDRKHTYVGSNNFDWRSFTQVKEIGVATFNCPCVGEDVGRILDILWDMGANDATLPSSWPPQYSTNANAASPYVVLQKDSPPMSIYFSSSPPGLNSCGRENDIDTMVRLIDDAHDYLWLAVMDYSLLLHFNNTYYDKVDAAIRRAAFDRHVHVHFMVSKWPHTENETYAFLHSFNAFSYSLPYGLGPDNKIRRGYIDVKLYEVPTEGFESIPYSRVQHNKYFMTEKAAYIGTSNWSAYYWEWTHGIGMVIGGDDTGGKTRIQKEMEEVYKRDWNSNLTRPISDFDLAGQPIKK